MEQGLDFVSSHYHWHHGGIIRKKIEPMLKKQKQNWYAHVHSLFCPFFSEQKAIELYKQLKAKCKS